PLRFTQWCDCEGISESLRMPADAILLATFAADTHKGGTGGRPRAQLDVWGYSYGTRQWCPLERRRLPRRKHPQDDQQERRRVQPSPPEPCQPPSVRSREGALVLSLSRPATLRALGCRLISFWGCRHLGELLPCTNRKYDLVYNPARNTDMAPQRS
ncbi:hypothetical protein BD626DRAFT_415296, partial [Schizophyllum amplum]